MKLYCTVLRGPLELSMLCSFAPLYFKICDANDEKHKLKSAGKIYLGISIATEYLVGFDRAFQLAILTD